MNKILSSLLLAFTVVGFGCNSSTSVSPASPAIYTPMKDNIVTDASGNRYRLVSLEKKLSDALSQPDLWERIEPLDTNRWYTPTLGSRLNPNNPPLFNSLAR